MGNEVPQTRVDNRRHYGASKGQTEYSLRIVSFYMVAFLVAFLNLSNAVPSLPLVRGKSRVARCMRHFCQKFVSCQQFVSWKVRGTHRPRIERRSSLGQQSVQFSGPIG